MRILHISPTYWPAFSIGGPIWSVHTLNKALVSAGAEIVVYTTNFAQPASGNKQQATRIDNIDGVEVHYFPVADVPAFAKAMARKWQYSLEMHRAIKENIADFDVAHITSVFLAASTPGAHYAKKAGVPYVISPRGALMKATLGKKGLKKKLYLSLVENRNLRDATVHFTVPMEEQEYKAAHLPMKNALVIPNALDASASQNDAETDAEIRESFREKYGIAEDAPVVLFLSRLSWKKGLDTLIPAFRKMLERYKQQAVSSKQPVLVIVGGDAEGYRSKVELEIKNSKLKIGRDVILTGELLGEEKEAAYAAADVFALPSYSENFGQVVLEAALHELPVVITPQVGVAPYITEADAGLVVEKDEDEVASAIAELLGDKEKARVMGRRGRELVESKFAPEQVAKEWKRAYAQLIAAD